MIIMIDYLPFLKFPPTSKKARISNASPTILSLIMIICQPSSYHCTQFSIIGLDCVLPSSYYHYITFPSLVLIVYYLEAFPSFYHSWLYANLHRIIVHTKFPSFVLIVVFYLPSNYLPFTNHDYMPTYYTVY